MSYLQMRAFLKYLFLLFIDLTIKNRFFFWGEYRRWQAFKKKRKSSSSSNEKEGMSRNVYYLVPGTGISGGVAVIFQHANRLCKRGFNVKILSLNNENNDAWFPHQSVEIIPYKKTKDILKSGDIDILIATGYSTAFTVDMARARRKMYFVQSDESRFFGDDKKLCEVIRETYGITFEYMTEALWIQKWLKEEYGYDVSYVPNGIDVDMFHRTEPIEPRKKKARILIEGSINVPFKGMDDAYNAIKDLDAEIWIVSNNGTPKVGWKYDRYFESVPIDEMKKIYSSCDIFLKMSRIEGFFGPPMEAMACGCAAVVGKVTGYDEYIIDGENALVVEQRDIDGAQKAIKRLMNNTVLREKLIKNGYKTAQEWSWNRSIDLLEEVVSK